MLHINKIVQQTSTNQSFKNPHVLTYRAPRPELTKKLYAEVCISVKGSNTTGRSLAMTDSGCDVPLITEDHLQTLFGNEWNKIKQRIRPTRVTLCSFTNDSIPLLGTLSINVSFGSITRELPIIFHVIRSTFHSPCPIVFGLKTLMRFRIDISQTTINNVVQPCLRTTIGQRQKILPSFYLADSELRAGFTKEITLQPGEHKTVRLYLPDHSHLITGSSVLASSSDYTQSHMNNIKVVPSLSIIRRDPYINKHFALGSIINDSNDAFNGTIKCSIDDASAYEAIKINEENKDKILQQKTLLDVDLSSNLYKYDGTLVLPPQSTDSTASTWTQIDSSAKASINIVKQPTFPINIKSDTTAINNNVKDTNFSLSEERHKIELSQIPEEDLAEFYSNNTAVQMGMQEVTDENFETEILEPKGYYIPTHEMHSAKDIVNLEELAPDIRPFIKDIFLDNYSETIALHALDRGSLSQTLGRYQLKLQPGAQLPSHKRVFFLAPQESEHMKTILSFLIKNGTVERCPTQGSAEHNFACSSYLIPRSNKNACGRIIIDYSPINKLLHREAISLPTIDHILGQLRDSCFYSSCDLAQAFYSIDITEDSRHLTQFSTPFGIFRFKVLPTGINSSPQSLNNFVTKMLCYAVCRDENGNIIYEKDGTAKLEHSPIAYIFFYYDDLLIATPWRGSLDESREFHFNILKQAIERIAIHKGKINYQKSTFFKSKLNFLGWNLMGNKILPDPKRIQKVMEFDLPGSTKGWRSFLGLVNSLRLNLGFHVLDKVTKLSNLTSSRNKTKPTAEQIKVFSDLKKALVSAPIYSSLILGTSEKIAFVDASSARDGSFGAILAQIVPPKEPKQTVPPYLYLDDETHRIIIEKKLPCIPLPYINDNEEPKQYFARSGTNHPPEYKYLTEEYKGLTEKTIDFSITLSLKTLLLANRCSTPFLDICTKILAELKKGITRLQVLDFICDKNRDDLRTYFAEISNGNLRYDKHHLIFQAIATALQRPVHVVSALPEHKEKTVYTFEHDRKKPPFYFLLSPSKHGPVSRPAHVDKSEIYNIAQHRGTFEIVAYQSRVLPAAMKNLHILDLENYAVLTSLFGFQKYIGHSELLCITDSKPLYYMFHEAVASSSAKLARWSSNLISTFPQMKLAFVDSINNLADFLSKRFDIKTPDLNLLRLPQYVQSDVTKLIDERVFTLQQWAQFIRDHPNFLTEDKPPMAKINSTLVHPIILNPKEPIFNNDSITENLFKYNAVRATINATRIRGLPRTTVQKSLKNLETTTAPIAFLQNKLQTEQIIQKQKTELKELYDETLMSNNQTLEKDNCIYTIHNNTLFRTKNDETKIMLPASLLTTLIAFIHLSTGHSGVDRLKLNLSNYYCPMLSTYAEKFVKCCLPCSLNNRSTHREKIATYPTPAQPFQCLALDYAEALHPVKNYTHLLVASDILTGYILIFPMKTKTADEYLMTFIYSIFQIFKPKELLTDNAQQFVCPKSTSTLAALGVRVIHTSSLSPASKGHAESYVKLAKTGLKKLLACCDTYSWLYLPSLYSIMYNSSRLSRHGQIPSEMLFGPNTRLSSNVWEIINNKPKLHPALSNSTEQIQNNNNQIKGILKPVQEYIDKSKQKRNIYINVNKQETDFNVGDIVLILNHNTAVGSTLPLKTVFLKTPYRVVQVRKTTLMVQRLTDMVSTIRHKDQVKKISTLDPIFETLPECVKKIIATPSEQWEGEDIAELFHLSELDTDGFPIFEGQELDDALAEPPTNFEEHFLPNDVTDSLNDGHNNQSDTPPSQTQPTQQTTTNETQPKNNTNNPQTLLSQINDSQYLQGSQENNPTTQPQQNQHQENDSTDSQYQNETSIQQNSETVTTKENNTSNENNPNLTNTSNPKALTNETEINNQVSPTNQSQIQPITEIINQESTQPLQHQQNIQEHQDDDIPALMDLNVPNKLKVKYPTQTEEIVDLPKRRGRPLKVKYLP